MRGAINVPELMSVIKEVLLHFTGLTTFWKPLEFRISPKINQWRFGSVFLNIFTTKPNSFLFFLKITNEKMNTRYGNVNVIFLGMDE